MTYELFTSYLPGLGHQWCFELCCSFPLA